MEGIKIDVETWFPNNESISVAVIDEISTETAKELQKNRKLILDSDPVLSVSAVKFFRDEKVTKFPRNLSFYFPTISALKIFRCPLKKITRSDLKSLNMLKELHIEYTDIVELKSNLFDDLKGIEVINFSCNKIKFVGHDIFNNLKKIKYIDLRENPAVNILFVNDHLHELEYTPGIYDFEEFQDILNGIFVKTSQVLLDIQKMLKDEKLKDYSIKIGGNEIKVHKFILIARSQKFAEMILKNENSNCLTLSDIEVGVFKMILDYIYDDEIPDEFDEKSVKLFEAAGKFKLEILKTEIGNILCENLVPENSFKILKLADEFNHDELKIKAFEKVKIFLNDKDLQDELIDNIEMLTKLVEAKIEYENRMEKMKGEMEKLIERDEIKNGH